VHEPVTCGLRKYVVRLSIPGTVYRYRLAADTTLVWCNCGLLDVFVGGKLEKALGCSCKDGARRSEAQTKCRTGNADEKSGDSRT
jgi:hypothetical protein